jgi:type V secretory pathway adhesin AidA
MYTVYRTFREVTGQNVTLLCDSPEDLRGKLWDVLEETCQRTVTPPQPAVTGSTANCTGVNTANTTAVSTSQPVQFHITFQQNVSVQESSPDACHSPPALLIISLSVLAVAVYIVVVALTVNIRIWRVKRGNDREGTQQVGTAEYSAMRPGPSAV